MANIQQHRPGEATIDVRISPTIERDYGRRDVFTSLRLENTRRFLNGTGIHTVSMGVAEEVLKDADTQRKDSSLPRGTPKAFASLAEKLTAAIRTAKGLWEDPGFDTAKERLIESPAQFGEGEWVRFRSEWIDDEDDGTRLQITRGFALHRITPCPDGEFVDDDGTRISYRWGYVARTADGDEGFYEPYLLQSLDYVRGHLRLVPKPKHVPQ